MPSPFYNTEGRLGLRKLEGISKVHDIGTGFQALGKDIESYLTSAKSIVATEQSRENTAYGVLATPDEVSVVLPENGLIAVAYQATWKESVQETARAAIFIGANQLVVAEPSGGGGVLLAQQASIIPDVPLGFTTLASFGAGLISPLAASSMPADATTGQVVGVVTGTVKYGGPCYIFAAAGTYKISVQFKSSSGKVTVKNRKLWAWVQA
jgi:hypothetical protein